MKEPTPKSVEEKYQRDALAHRDKILQAGWSPERANALARARFFHAVFPEEIESVPNHHQIQTGASDNEQ